MSVQWVACGTKGLSWVVLRWNLPEVRVTSEQKPSTKIINIVLQTSVRLF